MAQLTDAVKIQLFTVCRLIELLLIEILLKVLIQADQWNHQLRGSCAQCEQLKC